MFWLCPRSGDPHSPQAEAALWNSESPNLLGSDGASKQNRDVTQSAEGPSQSLPRRWASHILECGVQGG